MTISAETRGCIQWILQDDELFQFAQQIITEAPTISDAADDLRQLAADYTKGSLLRVDFYAAALWIRMVISDPKVPFHPEGESNGP